MKARKMEEEIKKKEKIGETKEKNIYIPRLKRKKEELIGTRK